MALEIFRLIGSVFVDTDQAEKSLKNTDKQGEKTASTLGSKLATGAKAAGKVVLGLGSAAAAAGTALYGVAMNAAGAMDEIDKGSAKIGISKQAYQEWGYVLGQNGMDISKLEVGMKTLVSKMDGASKGTKSAQESFEKLGVSIYDANGKLKDQETMMNEAMYALANMENGTEKARLATELFGKAGVEMMPMLNGGAEGMKALTDRAHELGLVVSDEAVTAGVVLGDTLDDAKQSFSAIMSKIGIEFMPIIQSLLDWFLAHMPTIQAICSTVFNALGAIVSWFGGIISSLTGKLSESGFSFQGLMTKMQTLFTSTMNVLRTIWTTVGQPVWSFIKQAVQLVAGYFQEKMPAIKEFVRGAFQDIKNIWENNLKPALTAIGNFINNVLAPAFKLVFNHIIKPAVDACFRGIAQLWNNSLKPILQGILDFVTGVFSGNFSKAFSGLVKAVGGIMDGLKTVVKTPVNAVINILNGFLKGINKLKFPDWVPGVGGKGINIPMIPLLAEGGVLARGQVGLLEGSGAEAVVPLDQNKRWVNAVAQDMDQAIGGGSGGQIAALLADILAAIEELTGMGIYLDKDALVGGLAKPLDRKLGQLQAAKARA